MKYLTNIKIQIAWMVAGTFILAIAGLHASTTEHVGRNGVAVTTQALSSVVKSDQVALVLAQLNTHQPVTLANLPSEALVNDAIDPRLSVRLRADGKLHLTGLSYAEMRDLGIQLPLFIIQ